MAKSPLKQNAARKSPALSAWRRACQSLGYSKPGAPFKPIPKKGSAAYNELYEEYQKELQMGNSHPVLNWFNSN